MQPIKRSMVLRKVTDSYASMELPRREVSREDLCGEAEVGDHKEGLLQAFEQSIGKMDPRDPGWSCREMLGWRTQGLAVVIQRQWLIHSRALQAAQHSLSPDFGQTMHWPSHNT